MATKISEEDKATIDEALKVAIDWLESNQFADKEEFEDQYKELEKVVQPIFATLYQQEGGVPGQAPEDFDFGGEEMPNYDEL